MGPDGKGTAQAAVYIDGQPVQYAGELTLPEITAAPEQMESTEAPPLLASMGFTVEQFNEAARLLHHSDMTVDEVMSHLNISDRTQFYKTFRERFQMSPAAYRKGWKE